jgi:hypothetical protein
LTQVPPNPKIQSLCRRIFPAGLERGIQPLLYLGVGDVGIEKGAAEGSRRVDGTTPCE